MKICHKCYEKKDFKEFGIDLQKIDLMNSYCKLCIRKRSKFQREKDPEYGKKYAEKYREDNKENLKEKRKISYYENLEKRREQCKRSYETHRHEIAKKRAETRRSAEGRVKETLRQREYRKNNPTKQGAVVTKWKKTNPKKSAAHTLVFWAIRCEILNRPDQCSECNCFCKPQAHHKDYSKPLKVIWLCRACHGKMHRKL